MIIYFAISNSNLPKILFPVKRNSNCFRNVHKTKTTQYYFWVAKMLCASFSLKKGLRERDSTRDRTILSLECVRYSNEFISFKPREEDRVTVVLRLITAYYFIVNCPCSVQIGLNVDISLHVEISKLLRIYRNSCLNTFRMRNSTPSLCSFRRAHKDFLTRHNRKLQKQPQIFFFLFLFCG